VDAVVGDGVSLFGFYGFYAPSSPTFAWTAGYTNPTSWSTLTTPGVPATLSAGANSAAYDSGDHIVYVAMQSQGLWRVVTH
jgi:hypothetical protein